jgi:hypothetical protein
MREANGKLWLQVEGRREKSGPFVGGVRRRWRAGVPALLQRSSNNTCKSPRFPSRAFLRLDRYASLECPAPLVSFISGLFI